jgi:hypothetical protein
MSGYEAPSTEEILLNTAFSTTAGATGHTVAWDDIFELPELLAADLLRHLSQSPEAVSEWITSLRKEDAKAHLRADQGLCAACGEIYTVELAGFTTEGYCSPFCRRKGKGMTREALPSTEPAGKVTSCIRCGQPVRPRPGGKCMHCGTKFAE